MSANIRVNAPKDLALILESVKNSVDYRMLALAKAFIIAMDEIEKRISPEIAKEVFQKANQHIQVNLTIGEYFNAGIKTR